MFTVYLEKSLVMFYNSDYDFTSFEEKMLGYIE